MKFTISSLINNYANTKKAIKNCGVSLSIENKVCLFMKDNKIFYKLFKPAVIDITANGIVINGFEENGFDRKGIRKYKFTEWFCGYEESIL